MHLPGNETECSEACLAEATCTGEALMSGRHWMAVPSAFRKSKCLARDCLVVLSAM